MRIAPALAPQEAQALERLLHVVEVTHANATTYDAGLDKLITAIDATHGSG